MVTLVDILNYAIEHQPTAVSVVPFTGLVRQAKVKRRKVTAYSREVMAQYGRVVAEVPAFIARNLQRPVDERDLLVLIHVPREVADEAIRRSESGIALPGELIR